ncbi:MAG: bifunctional transaldolase/phosoglucose isomerase [Calditrichaceae bacterium]
MNNLIKLLDAGQSYWLDNLTRKKIESGEIKKRVTRQGLRGITSNPSIFNKAISKENDYDRQIRKLAEQGKSVREIYEALTVKDVQDACDVLKSVYDASDGSDGFVSLEVSPYLARDTHGTIEEARRLFNKVNRPNCFIKIPGTEEGVPAIEQCLYEGININITLLFSIKSYEKVARAYINALEKRSNEGKDIKNIASVASFFLSRIDVLTDQLLGHYVIPEVTNGAPKPEDLFGKAAIASAKIAYRSFKKIFSGEKWQRLANKGARVQKPLWASTSTKDILYSDVRYIETLIGPDTVNTLPDASIEAFADHGKIIENSIEDEVDKAEKVFKDLKKTGIDIDFVTQQLVNEGIEKFITPYDNLMKNLSEKRLKFLPNKVSAQNINFGENEKQINKAFVSLNQKQIARRIYSRDPYIWKEDKNEAKLIRNRLGWLNIEDFIKRSDEIIKFAAEVKKEDFKNVVLLGMGGSSLCSVVARETFGSKQGFPELLVLDNTDPEAVKDIKSNIDIDKTLFIAASKSGTTTETISFEHYFYNLLEKKGIENPGKHFAVITDEGTPLHKEAEKLKFKKIFINPADYGGRYSVLSYFGLVPAALSGINIKELLNNALQMKISCGSFIPPESNPAFVLGTVLGINARLGKDKITFVISESVSAYGYWAEQLIAESTGKEGKGILPVAGETPGKPEVYEKDRVFVYLHSGKDEKETDEKKLNALIKAGHTVVKINLENKLALGSEFFKWELATALAGRIINVNPFNEPNVAESKKNSADLLKAWEEKGKFDEGKAQIIGKGISVYYNSDAGWAPKSKNLPEFLKSFTKLASSPDYFALLAYFLQTPSRDKLLQDIRIKVRDSRKVATTLGYGPRYMHSTGQLHKGGPNRGVYIMFTYDAEDDLAIPGEEYGFATLQKAQALGDFRSLNDKNRRIIRIHLGNDVDKALKTIHALI